MLVLGMPLLCASNEELAMNIVYMENLTNYRPMAFHMVSHVLTLGYAAMFAALLFFVLTLQFNSPKY